MTLAPRNAVYLSYSFRARYGSLWVRPGPWPEIRDIIKYFRQVDPAVECIRVSAPGGIGYWCDYHAGKWWVSFFPSDRGTGPPLLDEGGDR